MIEEIKMARYIDADALYEKVAEWEARALAVVEKLNSKPFEEMDANEITEWRKWSCILNERSAFKFDVADAPTADVVERKKGKWKRKAEYLWQGYECSLCGYEIASRTNYCSNCGADMRGR